MTQPFDPDGLRIRALLRERKQIEPGAHRRATLGDPTDVERVAEIDRELEALGVRRVQPPDEVADTLGPEPA